MLLEIQQLVVLQLRLTDTEDPAITCPADITTSNDTGDCSAVVTYTTPVGTDNCTGATTYSNGWTSKWKYIPSGSNNQYI
jgi:hypothetical protein